MDNFLSEIEKKLRGTSKPFSIIQNNDGFLSREDTKRIVAEGCGIQIFPCSSLELRVHYERWFKGSSTYVCYVVSDLNDILPDLKSEAYVAKFTVTDLLWGYDKQEVRKWNAPYSVIKSLFDTKQMRPLTPEQTRAAMGYNPGDSNVCNIDVLSENLNNITLDWLNVNCIETICNQLLTAIKNRMYPNLEIVINRINNDFQLFMDNSYNGLSNKNCIQRPYSVNSVLKHIEKNIVDKNEKVALVVVDGMSYWQYIMLRDVLKEKGIIPKDNISYAWLPSITKLSRQAIFRGENPSNNYLQNPASENKLFVNYWKKADVPESFICYKHNESFENLSMFTRVASVITYLDHYMHGCRDLKDLYDLSKNGIKEIVPQIIDFYNAGYKIYITADHGNVYAHSWRALSSEEKKVIFENESRGGRHLIFSDTGKKDYFLQKNPDIVDNLLVRDNCAVWRTPMCFKGENEVTHGGSHFLEMIVPFATIERKL